MTNNEGKFWSDQRAANPNTGGDVFIYVTSSVGKDRRYARVRVRDLLTYFFDPLQEAGPPQ